MSRRLKNIPILIPAMALLSLCGCEGRFETQIQVGQPTNSSRFTIERTAFGISQLSFVRDNTTEKEWLILNLGNGEIVLTDSNRLR